MGLEIINGVTHLERHLAGVHPRLFLTAAALEELRGRIGREPYASLFARVRAVAEDALARPLAGRPDRGHGCAMPQMALAYLLTEEARYLDGVTGYFRAVAAQPELDYSLVYGHVAGGMATAYDWLYHHLDAETAALARDTLERHARQVLERFGTVHGWAANIYTCNHLPVTLAGLLAAGCALYGDVEHCGPLVRLPLEKFRLMVEALGPDGASQEGLGYGEYYAEFLLKGLVLIRDLLNQDFLATCDWLKHTPLFYLYSMLPQERWTRRDCVMFFGDGVRYHWYGPDHQLRLLASLYRDGTAQWLAEATAAAGVCMDSNAALGLLWYDETVIPTPPDTLPTLHHFDDKGLVLMRSGWDGAEAVTGFKCGPCYGHFALNRYRHDIGGGHMCPDAGSFQIYAHGDRLIVDDGYSAKWTDQQNTVLVNGAGQTGEGQEWFETTRLRLEARGPAILRVNSTPAMDYILADVAPAYDPELGLTCFRRHFAWVKPDVWIIVDELESAEPASFSLHFHADQAFTETGPGQFTTHGAHGALCITPLAPQGVCGETFMQHLRVASGHPEAIRGMLVLCNAEPMCAARFVTVLEAYPADGAPERAVLEGDVVSVGSVKVQIGEQVELVVG